MLTRRHRTHGPNTGSRRAESKKNENSLKAAIKLKLSPAGLVFWRANVTDASQYVSGAQNKTKQKLLSCTIFQEKKSIIIFFQEYKAPFL